MNRTKLSILNALSAMTLTMVNGLLGIIVTKLILNTYGSDFNGLNSTVNQIINVLLILEGGFTLASNVALFGPINKNDYQTANSILSATRSKFKRIAVVFLLLGCIVAWIYSMLVKTGLPRDFVFFVIVMGVFPQAINLFFITTYRVLLQAQQKEYVISIFTALTIGLGHVVNIFVIMNAGSMWLIRFVTMSFALLNCLLIRLYTKKNNAFINLSTSPKPELIKGTSDVMAQKVTSVLYTSWPIVYLSISSNGGTLLASVYAVYNSVFIMIKALLHGIVDAPRLGFGQLLTEHKHEEIWPTFKEYEFISIFFTFVMMTTASGMILPFISIYTADVNDIAYYDTLIAVLMVLIGSLEMIHIPSGHMINMSGNFRVSKNIQIISCVLLMVLMTILGQLYGVYGMLISLCIVALVLAVMEIGYVHIVFFKKKLIEFLLMLTPFFVVGVLCAAIEMKGTSFISGIGSFIITGASTFIINVFVAFVLGFVFSRNETKRLLIRICSFPQRIIIKR